MVFLLHLKSSNTSHTGAVFHYTMLQMAVWWLLYVLMLLWTVRFPLQVRSFGKSHWFKVLHIACVTLALLVPLIPVIAAFATGGFNNTNFPPHFCTGRDSEATFYSLMVPIMIVLQIGVAVLTLIFWTLHKVSQWHRKLTKHRMHMHISLGLSISYLTSKKSYLP